jgi:hypothetical protein
MTENHVNVKQMMRWDWSMTRWDEAKQYSVLLLGGLIKMDGNGGFFLNFEIKKLKFDFQEIVCKNNFLFKLKFNWKKRKISKYYITVDTKLTNKPYLSNMIFHESLIFDLASSTCLKTADEDKFIQRKPTQPTAVLTNPKGQYLRALLLRKSEKLRTLYYEFTILLTQTSKDG